jgi:hypothetical protein
MVKNFLVLTTIATVLCGLTFAKAEATKPSSAKPKSIHHKSTSKHRRPRKSAWKHHGQQKIDSARATQIQEALIREKYLDGENTGTWDARTEAAMARYQAANGWQSKVTPDSRALIKLGLGPNHQSDLRNLDAKPASDALASTTSSTSSSKRQ